MDLSLLFPCVLLPIFSWAYGCIFCSKANHYYPNVSSSPSHAASVRQKLMRRGGGSGNNSDGTSSSGAALANGGLVVPTSAEIPKVTLHKTVTQEPSPRGLTDRNGSNWDHGSRSVRSYAQPNEGNEHYRGYGGNRRGNNSGPHHGSYGNRRVQDHGEWNHHNFGGGRDVQQYQRPMSRPYPRPPPLVTPPFFAPPPPPFGVPIGFPDMATPVFYVQQHIPPESLRAMPFVAPLPMFFPPPDSHFRAMLVKQIDYYFSTENLCSDTYLREKMGGEEFL